MKDDSVSFVVLRVDKANPLKQIRQKYYTWSFTC